MEEPIPKYSNLLFQFMKPSPKIYRTRKIKGKFLINAEENNNLETRSYYNLPTYSNQNLSKSYTRSVNEDLNHSLEPDFKLRQRIVNVRSQSPQIRPSRTDTLKKKIEIPQIRTEEATRRNNNPIQRGFASRENPGIIYDNPKRYNRFVSNRSPPKKIINHNSSRQFKFLKNQSMIEKKPRNSSQDFSEFRRLSHRTESLLGTQQKSYDDLEQKVCVLFNKFFVYLSKIETLKMKINKSNGELNCYSLFRRFCNMESGELGQREMNNLLESLDFPVDPNLLMKMIIYLSKYSEFQINPQNPNQPRNLFQQSTNSSKPPYPFCPIRLHYEEFRELFTSHKIVIPEVYLFCNWNSATNHQGLIPRSEYYLMRQILMLFGRQLVDISRVLKSLRVYQASEVFEFLLGFERNQGRDLGSPPFASKIPSFSNNPDFRGNMFNSEIQVGRERLGEFSKQNRDFLQGRNQSFKSLSRNTREPQFEEIPVNNVYMRERGNFEKRILDVTTVKRFLDFHEMQYLSEDLLLLMNALGASDGFLKENEFNAFFYSSLWDI